MPSSLRAITSMLTARGAAMVRHDRRAFLATADPAGAEGQALQFDAVRQVPLSSWHYALAQGPAPGASAWTTPVVLGVALTSYDTAMTHRTRVLSFVRRGPQWLVAQETGPPRDLWDLGPVTSLAGGPCLVLSDASSGELARALLGECQRAVPKVTQVWGRGWGRRAVIVLPQSEAELTRLLPGVGDLSQIPAMATAEPGVVGTRDVGAGDRILINPKAFSLLSDVGRAVVVRHEVTHVASRGATGPGVPTWFAEGLADYVGYLGSPLPLAVSAQELRLAVRAGRLPARLPSTSDFESSSGRLAETYEQSWCAVTFIVRRFGLATMLALYRHAGTDTSPGALDRAMRRDLGMSLVALTSAWRADLRRRLS